MHILIFEGTDPQGLTENARAGIGLSAQHYGKALQVCEPTVTFEITQPYHQDFSLDKLDLDEFDGAVFTGSGVSWSTQDKQAFPQQMAMEAVFNAGLPTLGSCNGMQLAASVLGGSVTASPNGMEIGVARDIRLTEAGKSHPYHTGRQGCFCSPCIHRDEVNTLPLGAQITATNEHSRVQAMVYERDGVKFWGTQYHPEYTVAQISAVLRKPGSLFQTDLEFIDILTALEDDQHLEVLPDLPVNPADLTDFNRLTELRNWLASLHDAVPAA